MKKSLLFLGAFLLSASMVYAATDGEAVGFVQAIDRNEIALAQLAEGKTGLDPKITEYSQMLEAAHKENLQKYEDLAKKSADLEPPATAGSILRMKGTKDLAMLTPLNGEDFSKAYMKTMVDGHQEALDLIDGTLMKDAKNADLKQQLAMTRMSVAEHLSKARDIQKTLK